MQERDIFIEALTNDASERAAYLDAACGDDHELRRRVEQLLTEHEKEQSFFLDGPFPGVNVTIDQPAKERLGTMIGPYRLLQQIGEGGFGVVYMAEQLEPVRRKVALKEIKPGMDTRQVIARFEAERQALAVMDHPNIARVFDAGATESGRPYFVMELVRGIPITQYCDENQLSIRERLELFATVCQAIQHAHTKGIIHRDIKPTNVLVTRQDGQPVVKVIDFGVAKAMGRQLTENTLFTEFAQMIGTPLYMSPEQAELSSADIDTRSDIYSLGVLLYELLTGSTPVSKEQFKQAAFDEIRRIIREDEPQKPSTRISTADAAPSIAAQRHTEPAKLARLVRGELDWIVMKALEKDRSRRYETANGFAKDIEHYLNDEPVLACPQSSLYRFRKFARRNKAALATSCAGMLAVVLALVGLSVSNVLIRREKDLKAAALKQAETNEKIAKANEQLARRRFYAAQMNLAMQAWHAGEYPRVLELLEGQRPGPDEEDLRGFEWYYLWRLCNGGRRLYLHGHTAGVFSVAYSPDGKTLASASWDRTVRLWDSATGKQQSLLGGHSRGVWTVAFSPDGKTLASSGQETGSLILWEVSTGKPLQNITGSAVSLAFSPDSSVIAGGLVTGSDFHVYLWDVATGTVRATFPQAGHAVGFFPDGKTLVTLTDRYYDSAVRFWDVESGSQRLTIPLRGIRVAVLSGDGTRLATSSFPAGVTLWDTVTGMVLTRIPTPFAMRGLAFSPDGKFLAGGSEARTVTVWEVETGRQLRQDVHLDHVWGVAFSPDGKSLASSTVAGVIKLWDMTPAEEAITIPNIGGVASLGFDSSGQTLLVGNSGPTKVIDVAAGKVAAALPASGVMAISTDAGTLAGPADGEEGTTWDVRTGRALFGFPLRRTNVFPGLTLSPDGKLVAAYYKLEGGNIVTLWDVATQQSRTLLGNPPDSNRYTVFCTEFSPNGELLAAGFEFQWVVVWKVATGEVKLEFSQEPDMMCVTAVAFSPDNKALAVGTDNGTVTLWEVESGIRLAFFRGHTTGVGSLAFSPDGNTLVTASADKTVRLWDVLTGQERSTLTGHRGPVLKVQFSPDGGTLATASDDGTVKLWRAATDPEARARRTSVDSDDPHYVIATQYNRSAWQLAMLDDPDERDPARAVELAQKAIALFPQSARYWLTLGVARYRAREWQAAVAAFDKSEELAPGKYGYKDFFRAMALWQLGDRKQARDRYERASEWVAQNAPYDPWMSPFQREAAELLELPAPSSLTPALPLGAIVREQAAVLLRRRAAIDERALSSLGGQEERWKLATEYYQLALALRDLEQLSESETICLQALNAFRNLADEDPQGIQSDDDIGWASHLLADVLTRSGRFEEAAPLARESLAQFQTLVEIRPDRPECHDAIHTSQALLGHVLGQLNKAEEAAHAQRESLAARQAADELRKLPPAQALLESARPYAEKRDWKQAAEALNKGFEQQPRSDFILCYATALARLLAGDVEGYARLAELLPPPKWDKWERLDFLRTRTIHPRGSADAAALVRLARLVYDKEVNNWNAQNLGLAHYRAGEFDEALKRFEETLKLADWYLYWPAVAMTHHQLGHADEARQWLDKSNGLFRHVTESGPEPLQVTKEPYWQDWAYFEVMRQEANALIGGEQ